MIYGALTSNDQVGECEPVLEVLIFASLVVLLHHERKIVVVRDVGLPY